ncbi:MAG: GAF domain-containing protein [Lachnospiraceae bacterium]|nr:GAF domain-containing protein [Lachnospiraceae bacterium]
MLNEKQLREIVDIGILLTDEKDKIKLLSHILNETMKISNCDAGTLYLYRNNALHFTIMRTISLGVSKGETGEKIDLPPIQMEENHVCAYAAIHRKMVNIPDVYHSSIANFAGPKSYDALTGYRTKSMLVIPMESTQGELLGILQLMNAKTEKGRNRSFNKEDEFMLRSLASQAAVSISNMMYLAEIKRQMYSFVEAFATLIDERTPYNGSHTRMVTIYAEIIARYVNRMYAQGVVKEYFDENRKEQLLLAAALHDIGKMAIPLEIMNKATRLGSRMEKIEDRFELLEAYYELDALHGKISKEKKENKIYFLKKSLEFIKQINNIGYLQPEAIKRIEKIASMHYTDKKGEKIAYLTPYEKECLCIRKGTLTKEERAIMEEHVLMTSKILSKMHFNMHYANVKTYAETHHELLNGTGYPKHLKEDELSMESRILAVCDIFDALTASDRPYKLPIPKEKAFLILYAMADEGKLDKTLIDWLEQALQDIDLKELEDFKMFYVSEVEE